MMERAILQEVLEELRALRREIVRPADIEALVDAQLLMRSKSTVRQLAESHADKAAGRTRAVTRVADLLG